MARLGIVTFSGRSGSQYKFNTYSLGTTFKKGLGAVYVITRRWQRESKGFQHRRISLGESGDLSRALPGGEESLAAQSRANCICIHSEPDAATRARIQQDLADQERPAAQ